MSDSISESLGLTDKWFENRSEEIRSGYEECEQIDQLMVNQISNVRLDELGEVDANISDYEKKLILTGYLIGVERIRLTSNPIKSMLDMFNDLKGEEND